ncbi:hypothetical protein [Companilactobacillus heilongjiangensis]|uniref:hypothetical protein n=1 Tax=Companilactobacillus heilongjiangensis TaxID=1074467 RepID=UPI00065FA5A4|nr:hypothetical protein [Companilactobacillus heilongjiangensis]
MLNISKKSRKRFNTIKPKTNVVNPFVTFNKHENVSVELSNYPNWMNSVDVKGFNNFYHDSEEACYVAYQILNKMISFIRTHSKEIISNQYTHCHTISSKEKRELIVKVNCQINKFSLDPQISLWEIAVSNSGGVRVIFGLYNNDDNFYFYPLFIDAHHQIYSDSKFRSNYSKICKTRFQDMKKPSY